MPDEYVKPEFRPYEERAVHAWLEDPAYRDQFVVRHDEDTAVYWLEGRAHVPPALVYGGEREKGTGVNWCERYVAWSSQGTYLATFHNKGIAIWAGDAFEKIGRYAHKGVKAVIFSPGEKYVVTCNFLDGDPRAFVVWDVKSGRELRNFALTKTEGGQPHAFKWSHDDQFRARGQGQDGRRRRERVHAAEHAAARQEEPAHRRRARVPVVARGEHARVLGARVRQLARARDARRDPEPQGAAAEEPLPRLGVQHPLAGAGRVHVRQGAAPHQVEEDALQQL